MTDPKSTSASRPASGSGGDAPSDGGMKEESFMSHLIELRRRLVRAALSIGVVFLCLLPFAAPLYDLLAIPLLNALPEGSKMLATGVVAPFMVPIKLTMLVAFAIALPAVLYQVWAFVAPGLYPHEKKLAAPIIFSSYALFLAGVAFCYFLVFGTVFHFIYQFAPKSVQVAPDIDSYFGFVMSMFLAFGLTFEVPIVLIMLVRFGLVTVAKLKEIRPYMIVAAFVIAAIVTPPDVFSQLMLAIPLCLLYEVGILVAGMLKPRAEAE